MRALISAAALSALVGAGIAVATPARAADDATVSVQVSDHRQVGASLTVSGDLTSASQAITYPATVTLQRDHSSETQMQPTDSTGHFSFSDTPDTRGSVTYTVSWLGDANHPSGATGHTTVTVAGKTPALTLRLGRSVVLTGHTVRVTAHLGAGTTNRAVTIYAKPYRRHRRQLDSGNVDLNGNRSVTDRVYRRTTFSVHFTGDDAYAPATATRVVRVRAILREHLQGGYASSGGFRLYHPGSNPSVFVHMVPGQSRRCLYFRAQHYYSHSWHTSAVSPCLRTNAHGELIGVLTGNHVVGEPYRVRAEWRGNRALLARDGSWLKLKFHR
jgi:hypothetical protein